MQAGRTLGDSWAGSGRIEGTRICVARNLHPTICPWHSVSARGPRTSESRTSRWDCGLAFLVMLHAPVPLPCHHVRGLWFWERPACKATMPSSVSRSCHVDKWQWRPSRLVETKWKTRCAGPHQVASGLKRRCIPRARVCS